MVMAVSFQGAACLQLELKLKTELVKNLQLSVTSRSILNQKGKEYTNQKLYFKKMFSMPFYFLFYLFIIYLFSGIENVRSGGN